ncbi:hypothetical protein, partial [Bradyrhizobium sp. JYMT SZCCT0428]|uniref:hypothetical protein n=1 Tax=Bradyrhizobium sp. JYMT SZCCT0428 TaxID=2807673 RepID=UPI001BA9FC30
RRIKAGRPWRRSRTIHRKQPTFATKSAISDHSHRSKLQLYIRFQVQQEQLIALAARPQGVKLRNRS